MNAIFFLKRERESMTEGVCMCKTERGEERKRERERESESESVHGTMWDLVGGGGMSFGISFVFILSLCFFFSFHSNRGLVSKQFLY